MLSRKPCYVRLTNSTVNIWTIEGDAIVVFVSLEHNKDWVEKIIAGLGISEEELKEKHHTAIETTLEENIYNDIFQQDTK